MCLLWIPKAHTFQQADKRRKNVFCFVCHSVPPVCLQSCLYPCVCDLMFTCYQLLSGQEGGPAPPSTRPSANGQGHRLTQYFKGTLRDSWKPVKGVQDLQKEKIHTSGCMHANRCVSGQRSRYPPNARLHYVCMSGGGCSLLTGTGDARSLSLCSPCPNAGRSSCERRKRESS